MDEQKPSKDLPACPVETALMRIGDKRKVLILRHPMSGTKRLGELKESIGNVSQKVLTAQLRDMEGTGLVHRRRWNTALGRSLKLGAMRTWGEGHKAQSAG